MAKKKIIRKSNRTLNLFAEGGGFNAQGIAGAAGGLMSAIPNINKSSNIAEKAVYGDSSQDPTARMLGDITGASTKGAINEITAQATALNTGIVNEMNENTGISSNDDLMSAWGTRTNADLGIDPVTKSKLGWSDVGDNLLASGQGAMQGMSIGGPWGALIGGIVGGVNNIVSLFGRNKRREKINNAISTANATINNTERMRDNALFNTSSNIATQSNLNDLANYSAFGGPIDTFGGAIDYQLASENNKNRELNAMSKYKLTSMPNSFKAIPEIKTFGEGGNLHSSISNIGQHGGIFSNGVTIIGNGGTHEENSMQGVPMGIDNEGIPNLVEEGEVKYNDYIFSNRLKVPKEYKKKYKVKGDTFADVANEIQKESSERPNDPISKAGLEKGMGRLTQAQEMVRQEMQAKEAKKQFNNMTPEEQLGIMEMANQQPIQGQQFACGGKMKGRRYDDGGDLYLKWLQDPYTKSLYETSLATSWNYNKDLRQAKRQAKRKKTAFGEFMANPENLKYAPAAASGIATITDAFGWTNQPDFTNAELVEESGRNLRDVSATPLGNYLTYNPLDRNYYTNKLNAQAGATRSAIVNQSGGNRATAMAGLLAADYNAQSQLGDLARQAEEYNLNQRMQVEQFNRGTNQFNSQQALQADIANQGNDRARMQAAIQGAQMREQISGASDAARMGNLQTFIDNLSNIGIDAIEEGRFNTAMANMGVTYTDSQLQNLGKKQARSILKQQGFSEKDINTRIEKIFK